LVQKTGLKNRISPYISPDQYHLLLDLQGGAEGSPDWKYGETLIRNSYFQEYAQELAEDIGAVGRNAQWPNAYIDWEEAADALKQDYISVNFGDVEYWIRG